ncbi:hypothetical protein OUZ56_005302 [Daphnia magna]|uniref:Uncharacterized protein n=1 Tax=Daphnia magna TaxID=35525 RepID=A0ABQ9YSH5_9CRUS|nr:hypothetical protein OUZ56_005302 [Daphnia magna]
MSPRTTESGWPGVGKKTRQNLPMRGRTKGAETSSVDEEERSVEGRGRSLNVTICRADVVASLSWQYSLSWQ